MLGLWFVIGLPTYLALCVGIGKFIATGMGSDAPEPDLRSPPSPD